MSKFKVGDIVEIVNLNQDWQDAHVDSGLYLKQRGIVIDVDPLHNGIWNIQPFYSHPVYGYKQINLLEDDIKLYTPPEYKIGDKATVSCKITSDMIPEEVDDENIFLSWVPRMDKSIGHTYKVIEISNRFYTMVCLNIYPDEPKGQGDYWFDTHSLSKVDSSTNSYQCGLNLLKNLW